MLLSHQHSPEKAMPRDTLEMVNFSVYLFSKFGRQLTVKTNMTILKLLKTAQISKTEDSLTTHNASPEP